MTGGMAFVYDADGLFERHVNPELHSSLLALLLVQQSGPEMTVNQARTLF